MAEEYLKFFDFTGMTLDYSLRYVPLWKPNALVLVAGLFAVLAWVKQWELKIVKRGK